MQCQVESLTINVILQTWRLVGKPPLAQRWKTADYTTKNHRWANVGPLVAKSADHTLLGHRWNVIWVTALVLTHTDI